MTSTQNSNPETEEKLNKFACKICLDVANEPVITPCGHLYCWSCIHNWGKHKGMQTTCPYCNNGIDIEKLTPIYTGEEKSSSSDLPKRPENEREQNTNHEQNNRDNGGNFFENNNIQFGFMPGIFGLFSGFGVQMNFGNNFHNPGNANRNQEPNNRLLMLIPFFLIFFEIGMSVFENFFFREEYEPLSSHGRSESSNYNKKTKSYQESYRHQRTNIYNTEPDDYFSLFDSEVLMAICLILIILSINYFMNRFAAERSARN